MVCKSARFGAYVLFQGFLLISIGITILLKDAKSFHKSRRSSPEFTNAIYPSSGVSQAVLEIILSNFNILVGLFGLITFCSAGKPSITGLLLATIAIDSVCRIALCGLMLKSARNMEGTIANSIGEVIELYGSYENSNASQFTKAVDAFAEKERCCGWASSHDSIGLYQNSTWYKKLIANSDVQMDMRLDRITKKTVRLLLPIHCCSLLNINVSKKELSMPNAAGYCNEIYDLSEARKSGAIHELDCLLVSTDRMRTVMLIYTGVQAIIVVINVLLASAATNYMNAFLVEALSKRELAIDDYDDD